ncbi:MAG: TetR/AcrR family transcriptional regulator [Candidatus Izemoplasmatales bacterium]|nr:TetR/AcrR family transcriptional regulator [Candidatus Izemoplasmatales bacterium]MDD4069518.1 TetR/AcrR family transcriptional regulator [Candidatus Izemoplasmatales bacterium]MDY0138150.1 TetR/AcrR family transcriptional regulator [Candidatus Izemoplasmatales bacterium]
MQSTRDRILDATIGFIKIDPSLNQVSISDIAKIADIGKSTVYEYFENKDALIEEAYFHLLDKYHTILISKIENKTFKEAMIEQLSKILEVMEDVKIIMEVIMNTTTKLGFLRFNPCSEKIELIQKNMTDRFNDIFKLGLVNGEISIDDRPYRSNVIQSIISGLMFQYVDNKIDIKRDELLELIYNEIYRTL